MEIQLGFQEEGYLPVNIRLTTQTKVDFQNAKAMHTDVIALALYQ